MKRAMVFIDGSNFYYGLKRAGIHTARLNYARIAEKLADNRAVVEVRFYVGRLKTEEGANAEYAAREYDKQRAFLDKLRRQGVTVHLGRVEGTVGNWKEKAVDVMIAVDMVAFAYKRKFDVAYLLSADGDFTPAVAKVRETGRRVFVASPVAGYEIAQAADLFIRLRPKFFKGCRD